MYGDFSRRIGELHRHYSLLLRQQGRLDLDVDFNELGETIFRYLQQLVMDVIGPYGTAVGTEGFEVTMHEDGPHIGEGFYYLSGRRCEYTGRRSSLGPPPAEADPHVRVLRSNVSYFEDRPPEEGPYLVFLRAWERTIAPVQDPDLADVAFALGGDTVVRSQLVWQVLASATLPDGEGIEDYSEEEEEEEDKEYYHHHHPHHHDDDERREEARRDEERREGERHHHDEHHHHDERRDRELRRARRVGRRAIRAWYDYEENVRRRSRQSRGALRATLVPGSEPYVRNELHRIEVHHGGRPGACSFKYSPDNGSRLFRFTEPAAGTADDADATRTEQSSTELLLRGEGDSVAGLRSGMWLEYVDDLCRLPGEAPMLRITAVHEVSAHEGNGRVTVEGSIPVTGDVNTNLHPVLRQWNGYVAGDDLPWVPVDAPGQRHGQEEQQAVVQFGNVLSLTFGTGHHPFHSGDHWLLFTRTKVAGLAGQAAAGEFEAPERFAYYEAPLALITGEGDPVDLRSTFYGSAIWEPRTSGRTDDR